MRRRRSRRVLSEDRDVLGVTSERADVALHPAECLRLVHVPVADQWLVFAGRRCELRMGEPSRVAEAVVQRDDHDAAFRKGLAVVSRQMRAADHVAAAVEPHHHGCASRADRCRQWGRGSMPRSPDTRRRSVTAIGFGVGGTKPVVVRRASFNDAGLRGRPGRSPPGGRRRDAEIAPTWHPRCAGATSIVVAPRRVSVRQSKVDPERAKQAPEAS